MSTPAFPLTSPDRYRRPAWKTAGIIVLSVLVGLLCLIGVGSIVDRVTEANEPQTASAGSSALPVEQPRDVPQQLSDEQLKSPAGVVVTYLGATPSYWNNFGAGGWADQVDTVNVEGDDVLITLSQPFSASTSYQDEATEIRAWAVGELRQHRDNATVAGVDVVAVVSSDGVLVGYEKL